MVIVSLENITTKEFALLMVEVLLEILKKKLKPERNWRLHRKRQKKSKLDPTSTRIKILQSSIPIKKKKFDSLVKKADNLERSGKKVSENLIADLNALRAGIKNTKSQIKIEEQKQVQIKQTYRRDVEHFVLLKAHQMKNKAKTAKQKEKLHIAQIFCRNKEQCLDCWKHATEFVKNFSSTSITYKTDIFSVSSSPEKAEDIAMTLTLLSDSLKENTKIILLQIRCHREARGKKACLNDFRNISSN